MTERSSQHLSDYWDSSKESHLRRHLAEAHPEGSPTDNFTFKVISIHSSALARQVMEAWLIKSFHGGTLLNTKYEYHHGILPSLTTSDPHSQLTEIPKRPSDHRKAEEMIYLEEKRKILRQQEDDNQKPRKRRRHEEIDKDKREIRKDKEIKIKENKKRKL